MLVKNIFFTNIFIARCSFLSTFFYTLKNVIVIKIFSCHNVFLNTEKMREFYIVISSFLMSFSCCFFRFDKQVSDLKTFSNNFEIGFQKQLETYIISKLSLALIYKLSNLCFHYIIFSSRFRIMFSKYLF